MATLRLFAGAREAAGVSTVRVEGGTVAEVLTAATTTYGATFAEVLATCKVWLNGEPAEPADVVADNDEVAVLPPVSGGCR